MAYLLIPLTLSFTEQFFISVKSGLSIISFMDHTFVVASKKSSLDFPGGTVVKTLPANAGDAGSSPGLGGSDMPQRD